jgi:hypothetical protein
MICPQGATFSKRLTWSIDDVPVDLTGYTAKMQAKDKHGVGCEAVINITTENGGITLDSLGHIDLLVSATETATLYAKDYVYDIELTTGSSVYRVVEGKFIVTPEVTV